MSRSPTSHQVRNAVVAQTWVVLAVLLLTWSAASSATGTAPSIAGGSTCGAPGQTVQVPVAFTADGSVVALQFDLGLVGGAVISAALHLGPRHRSGIAGVRPTLSADIREQGWKWSLPPG
jgi:hypothetical protein